VEISNEPAVSALGVTTECEGWGQLIVAVGDIHTAEPFPDSLGSKQQRVHVRVRLLAALPRVILPSERLRVAKRLRCRTGEEPERLALR
jgi:hypothetical protein